MEKLKCLIKPIKQQFRWSQAFKYHNYSYRRATKIKVDSQCSERQVLEYTSESEFSIVVGIVCGWYKVDLASINGGSAVEVSIGLMKQITQKVRDIGSQISAASHTHIMGSIAISFHPHQGEKYRTHHKLFNNPKIISIGLEPIKKSEKRNGYYWESGAMEVPQLCGSVWY